MKISKVPNNIVCSTRVLIHKRKDKWTISLRLGALHYQMIQNISIRMFCYADDGHGMSITNLPAGKFSEVGGAALSGPEPWNIRHVVDENSPIKHVDFGAEESVKEALEEGFDIFVQGFDATTGRSVGMQRHFGWDPEEAGSGYVVYAPEGSMASSMVKMTVEEQALHPSNAGKKWGIDWRGFNALKLHSGADPM